MTAAITPIENAPISKVAAFDYAEAGLADDVVVQAKAAVTRIRKRGANIQTAILEIGQDLLWAKEALGHGNFLPWLSAELDMSLSTAR